MNPGDNETPAGSPEIEPDQIIPEEPHPGAHPYREWAAIERTRRAKFASAARDVAPRVFALFFGALLVSSLLYLVVVDLPPRLVSSNFEKEETRLTAESNMRAALLQALGGSVLLIGLYFTARSFRASQDAQITERYSRAITQLSEDSEAVRLGAVLALERIWRDSRDDYLPILEVLLAFLRGRASLESSLTYEKVPSDVQAVLSVFGRRPYPRIEDRRLDLHGLSLPWVDLWGGNYRDVDFSYTILDHAMMRETDFGGGSFHSSSLIGAGMIQAKLRDASLAHANLAGAFVCGADLTDANLSEANLTKTDLGCRYTPEGALDTRAARLDGCLVEDAVMNGTILVGADLTKVQLLAEAQVVASIIDDTTLLPESLRHLQDPNLSRKGAPHHH